MKSILKYTLLLLGPAALLLSGCELEQAPEWDEPAVLYARIEGTEPGTKTSYDSDGPVGEFQWSEGDQIAVHFSNGSYVTGTVAASTGEVSVQLPSGATRDYYAVYPATAAVATNYGNPTLQITYPADYDISDIVSGSSTTRTADFSPCPMVAVNDVDSDVLCFYHVGGLIRLTLLSMPEETRQVRVTFDRDVTGTFTVSNPAGVEPIVTTGGSASNKVVTFTLAPAGSSVGSLSSGMVLNIPVPCGTYEGFTVECVDMSDAVIASEVCTRSLTLARHHGTRISISPGEVETVTLNTPLTIMPRENGTIITIKNPGGTLTYKWSFDGGKTKHSDNATTIYIPANKGQKVRLYQDGATQLGQNAAAVISVDKSSYVYGNVMSLASEQDFATENTLVNYQFARLFLGAGMLQSHPTHELFLPAENLAPYCYQSMFQGCTGLTAAPVLPAPNMAEYCYYGMFQGCTGLTTAPVLSSQNLAPYCYRSMFQGCTGLTAAPVLPAPNMARECYYGMFQGCTGLTAAPVLSSQNLAHGCYQSMFRDCTGLTAAPSLPATTLAPNCYYGMFRGCTGLTTAPAVLPAENTPMYTYDPDGAPYPAGEWVVNGRNVYREMFYGCEKLTQAPVIRIKGVSDSGCNSMFYKCTKLKYAPDFEPTYVGLTACSNMFDFCEALTDGPRSLPVTMVDGASAFAYMFRGCSSLVETVPELPAIELPYAFSYQHMYENCSALIKAPVIKAKSGWGQGHFGYMFSGCSSLTFVECHWDDPSLSFDTNGIMVNPFTDWLNGVPDTGGTFRKKSGTDWARTTSGIPAGWTVIDI